MYIDRVWPSFLVSYLFMALILALGGEGLPMERKMCAYNCCPNCRLQVEAGLISGFLVIYECAKCGAKYCRECASYCPSCGSMRRLEVEKLYA